MYDIKHVCTYIIHNEWYSHDLAVESSKEELICKMLALLYAEPYK